MSEEFYFPQMTEDEIFKFEILLRSVLDHGQVVLDQSPYDLSFMQDLVARKQVVEEIEGESKWDRLDRESRELFEDLKGFRSNLGGIDDAAETMSFFRTATSLLEKLVSLQERAQNLKRVHAFHEAVLSIMEDVLDADQRNAVIERLNKARSGE